MSECVSSLYKYVERDTPKSTSGANERNQLLAIAVAIGGFVRVLNFDDVSPGIGLAAIEIGEAVNLLRRVPDVVHQDVQATLFFFDARHPRAHLALSGVLNPVRDARGKFVVAQLCAYIPQSLPRPTPLQVMQAFSDG